MSEKGVDTGEDGTIGGYTNCCLTLRADLAREISSLGSFHNTNVRLNV